jgi:hypothetical protein
MVKNDDKMNNLTYVLKNRKCVDMDSVYHHITYGYVIHKMISTFTLSCYLVEHKAILLFIK